MPELLATVAQGGPFEMPEREVSELSVDEGLSVYPFPFTQEGRDVGAASRKPVPFSELLRLLDDVAEQVANLPEGAPFDVRVSE